MPLLPFLAPAAPGGPRTRLPHRPARAPTRGRARLRRVLAAVLAGAAVAGAGGLAVSRPQAGAVPVVVASSLVAAGTPLTAGLLQVRHLPADAVPQRAVTDASVAVGREAASVLAPGEVLTEHDLATATLLTGHGGSRAVFVPVPQPSVLGALGGGDRVDVHSPVDGSAVVADALVLSVHGGPDGGLWLAVEPEGAAALAAARGADPAGGALLISVRPARTA